MKFNFNEAPSRLGTECFKWDYQGKGLGDHPLPLGVADSDYKAPDVVVKALVKRAEHGIYGYTRGGDKYQDAVKWWMDTRYDWKIEKEWITPIGGIVPACGICVLAYTNPGDKVVVQAPVYNPFYSCIVENGRKIAYNWLVETHNKETNTYHYSINFEELEQLFIDGAKMMIFCSPANPVGRVWTKEEMRKIFDIIKKYNAVIVSDEIHADLILNGNKFYTAGNFTDMYDRLVVCTAPSKTFNIAGIADSNIIIPDKDLRAKYQDVQLNKLHISVNLFGYAAGEAAYTPEGADWADQQMVHLSRQYNTAKDYISKKIPKWGFTEQEGTYLLWINCEDTGLRGVALTDAFKEFGMFVNSGDVYGGKIYGGTDRYETYVRVNTACTEKTLDEALIQMSKLADKYHK